MIIIIMIFNKSEKVFWCDLIIIHFIYCFRISLIKEETCDLFTLIGMFRMIDLFKTGYQQFSPLWKEILSEMCFKQIRKTAEMDPSDFYFPTDIWGPTLYELAATFHSWTANRNKLLDLMTPLYFARVASFVRQSWEMSSQEAETLVEEQAARFEEHKDYLIDMWDKKSKQKTEPLS